MAGFIPGILSAINSNKAHKARVKADVASKAAYKEKYKGTQMENWGYYEQKDYEEVEAAADAQIRTHQNQERALANAWAKVGCNPDGTPLQKKAEAVPDGAPLQKKTEEAEPPMTAKEKIT
jgi:hypothetical protein